MNTNDMKNELVHLGGGAHALAYQILGNVDDAADAVQDALIAVLGKPRAYDPNKGPLKPWFFRVVRNRSFDMLRQRRPTEPGVDLIADDAATPEQTTEDDERDRVLQTALSKIDPNHREIVVLRDYLGLSYAEIAGVLGVASGTVMSRLHRARLALREVLENV